MRILSKKKFLVLALCALFGPLSVNAQQVSLKLKDGTVGEAIESLKKQTGYSIWYKQNELNINLRVSIDEKDKPFQDVLESVLKGQSVNYEIKGNYVTIYKENQVPVKAGKSKTINGVVFDENNEPLPSAAVSIKGTTTGTVTDFDGNFSLPVREGETLLFNYVGYQPQEMLVDGNNTYKVALSPSTQNVKEVVVTAMGVKKNVRAITYSTQGLDTKDLVTVKSGNFTNSISGKISNVNVQQSSGGAGSANKIVLRGNNSLNGTGSPLIVIDGMPVSNYNPHSSTDQGAFGGVSLGADGLSSINPDDIEDMQVLKGPSAAALYGNQAANGAILITTKTGKAGKARIEVSTNTTFDRAAYKPKFQNEYVGIEGAYRESWGDKSSAAAGLEKYYDDFLQTGVNTTNSVTMTAGNEIARVFASYANTYSKGLIPRNDMNRNNFNIRGTSKFFDNKLELDMKVNYMMQKTNNPFAPGIYMNPLISFYNMDAGLDLNKYRNYELKGQAPYIGSDGYEEVNPNRYYQNWPVAPREDYENPYWISNRERNINNISRMLMSASLKYNVTDWMYIQARGTIDDTDDRMETKLYQGTNLITAKHNGDYINIESGARQYYGDIMANATKEFGKFRVAALLGGAINDFTSSGIKSTGNKGYISQPNFFSVSNIDFKNGGYFENLYSRKQVQSFFYSLEVGWNNALFLTHTGRNDWASSLPADNNSYFFPSVGVSAILSELIPMNKETVNLLKLRGSYTEVGAELPPFITKMTSRVGTDGGLINPDVSVRPGETLKPELTKSLEIGAELGLLQNLLRFDFTYYKTNTTNQLFRILAPLGSGMNYYWVNGGDIQNSGFEASLSVAPQFGEVKWISTVNFSHNKNEVKKLHPGAPSFDISTDDKGRFVSRVMVGGSLGDMYAYKIAKDENGDLLLKDKYINGQIVGSEPTLTQKKEYVGNPNPDFMLSWNNSFTWKGLNLSFLIDGRFGGEIISLTESLLDYSGNSQRTADARNAGGVKIGDHTFNAQSYYSLIGGKSGAWGEYVYDATTIRLRELVVGYDLPQRWFKSTPIQQLRVSLVGRNLFYIYKPAPVDSEISSFSDNLMSGVETYALPSTRSFGFSVNVAF
ncbi:MAG: SusC/RagA family TonB-linked outer membrane protein [Bacteroidales bacterium]